MLQIEEKLAQDILNYLANQPFKDVYSFVGQLQQIKPIATEKKDP